MGRAPQPGAPQRVSAHVVPKPAPFASDDEDEKTTIEEGGWEDEASTTVEQGEVAAKLRALMPSANGGAIATPRPNTSITSTTGGVSEELTVDDQRGAAALAKLPPPLVARLVVTAGNDAGQAIEVRPGKTYTVGRGIDNDLVLTDIAVSRKHFDIRADLRAEGGSAWVLTDRGSGNGTLVNARIEDAPFMLAAGDVIEVGNTSFRFDLPNGAPRVAQPYDGGDDDLELSTVQGKPLHETAAAGAVDPPRPPPKPSRQMPIPPTPAALPSPPRAPSLSGQMPAMSERGVSGAPVIPPPGPTQPLPRPKTLPPPSPRSRTPSTRPPISERRPATQPPPLPLDSNRPGRAGMTGAMQAMPAGLGANLPPPLGSQPLPIARQPLPPAPIVDLPLSASPTTIPGQGVVHAHPARLPFAYPGAPAHTGYPHRPSQPPSAMGQPLSASIPPAMGGPIGPLGTPLGRPHRMTGQMNGQMPHGSAMDSSRQLPMRPSLQVASGMPAREAPSTALVQPMSYGGGPAPEMAVAQPFPASSPLSRKVKMGLAGFGLALFAALATIAIIKATSRDPEPEPEPVATGSATVDPIATKAPDVAPPAPHVTPIPTPPPAPVTKQPQAVATAPTQPPAPTPPAPAPTPPPAPAPTPAKVVEAAPPPAPVAPAPAPTPVASRPTPPPAPATRRPEKPPEKAPEKRVAAVERPEPRNTERPEPRAAKHSGRSVQDIKNEANARYRAKDFSGAAQAISSQLSSLSADDAQDLKGIANIYSQLGRAYAVGMAPGTKSTEAYVALSRAISLDRDAGSAFVTELEEHQVQAATRAASSFMAAKEYEAAFQAVRVAESLGSTSPNNKTIRGMLENTANDLYKDAQSSIGNDPDGAKKKLRTVLNIIDAKNPLRSKAQRLLNGS